MHNAGDKMFCKKGLNYYFDDYHFIEGRYYLIVYKNIDYPGVLVFLVMFFILMLN